jgi:hypothetical protein
MVLKDPNHTVSDITTHTPNIGLEIIIWHRILNRGVRILIICVYYFQHVCYYFLWNQQQGECDTIIAYAQFKLNFNLLTEL